MSPAAPDITLVNMCSDAVTGERVMPLGALHLVAALDEAGFAVELRDIQLMPQVAGPAEAIAEAFETDAPVLGVSLMSDRMPETIFALRMFKERHPDKVVLVGGAGPTEVAGPLVRAFPFIDGVARGEGEETLVEVMSLLRAGGRKKLAGRIGGVAGLTANVSGRFVEGPDRPRLRDVDRLPYPERCRWDLSPYADASLMTARGCPFRCSFCSIVALWGQTMAYRSVERVVDEIAWLAARKPGAYVHIEDDTFTVNRKRVVAICDEIRRRGIDVRWGCTARVDMIDEGLAEVMHGAGCRSLFLGIESGSDRVRDQVLKGFSSRDVMVRVEMLIRYFHVTCHYIWGYPDETLSDFYETFLHVAHLSAMGVEARHSHLVPFPRSPLVREYTGALRFRASFPFPRLFLLDPKAPYVDEVRAHPEVFTPYFTLETPEEERKFAFVAEMSRFERAS